MSIAVDVAVSPPATPVASLLLLARLGKQRFALPVAPIARILPMAAPLPLVAPAPGVIGGLVIAGTLLPIVDPRPALGLPRGVPGIAQHLLLIDTERPFLLWIERAETIERVCVQGEYVAGQTPPAVGRCLSPGARPPRVRARRRCRFGSGGVVTMADAPLPIALPAPVRAAFRDLVEARVGIRLNRHQIAGLDDTVAATLRALRASVTPAALLATFASGG